MNNYIHYNDYIYIFVNHFNNIAIIIIYVIIVQARSYEEVRTLFLIFFAGCTSGISYSIIQFITNYVYVIVVTISYNN